MTTFISRSIPFKDILRDLAKEMNTSFSQSCEEYILEIPPHIGEGSIRGINFKEGLGLMMYDCLFYKEVEIKFILNEVHPLKFMFCEEGCFKHRFQGSEDANEVERFQSVIVASDRKRGHILNFKPGVRTKINNLEIDRRVFYNSKSCEINRLNSDLRELFKDLEGNKPFYYHGNYSLKTADAFTRISNFEGAPFIRNLFIQSQTYHVFFIQVLEYKDAQSPKENQSILLKQELNLIYEAANIINSDLLNFRGVKELAFEVGLNPNKLQNGFKEIYGKTVNLYIQEKRLSEAEVLIKNTDLTFSQISDKVGISSKSYFSKIFKDKYGLTPSQIRRNHMEKIINR